MGKDEMMMGTVQMPKQIGSNRRRSPHIGNPPNREGHCDLDGAALVQRADDTESVFEERMRTYHSSRAPVIEHYRTLGRFIKMDGDRSIGGIAADIVAAVDQFQPLR